MSTFLKERSHQEELMDDLSSHGPVINQTLHELEVINRLLGGNQVTINGIKKLLGDAHEISVVDIGCGGGDMLKLMADWFRKKNIRASITGIDANPNIIDYAQRNTSEYPEINYLSMDVLSDDFRSLSCDIFTSTLFAHHLTNEELLLLLQRMKFQARIGIIINDIHRHWLAYHSIKLLTGIFSKSPMVKNDAAVSVERSFLKQELANLLFQANIRDFAIRWFWAFRWQVVAKVS
jgi:2-polyprenyl-3-methyl-5-hydroxy-6-metoxy-1,4-benzoquinol methylase